jgi:hypothetical protein
MMKLTTPFLGKNRCRGFLCSLADGPAIILGFALLHLIVTFVWIRDWYEEFGQSPITGFYPDSFVIVPLVLVVASLFLLIRKGWSCVFAFLISVWVVYSIGYSGLRGVAAAHDTPLLTLGTLQRWFTQVWVGQPQYLLQLALAFLIAGYAFVVVSRQRLHSGRRQEPTQS